MNVSVRQVSLMGVLLILAVAVVYVWRSAPTQPDVAAGRTAAERFLELIRTGKPAVAWELTTAEFKSYEGRESFVKSVKKHPELLKPTTFVSVQQVTLQESPRTEFEYRASNGRTTVRLLAGHDRGEWRVDRMTID